MWLLGVIVALLLLVLAATGLVKATGWWRRRAGGRVLEGRPLTRASRGVDLQVLLFRTRPWHGMMPGRAHPARGDLLLTTERFVLTSDRGLLVDAAPQGARLGAVRCTGPRRLVLEGRVPHPDGSSGLFRLELVVDDAPGWAGALRPYADEVTEGPAAWRQG